MTESKIVETKLTTRTSKGTLVRVPATLEYTQGRIFFLKSPFALKDEIKSMKGSRWHGYEEENPRKIWSIEDSQRNRFQLGFLQGEDVYAWFDREQQAFEYDKPLMPHQVDLANACLSYHYQILAAEMGCVDGNAIVHLNHAGRGFKLTLKELFVKFTSAKNHAGKLGQKTWDSSLPTYIRSLKGEALGLNPIVNVLAKGIKEVVKLTLASGKAVILTPDHEVATGYDTWASAGTLSIGQTVLSQGAVEFVPHFDRVESVKSAGAIEVYDIVCADPYRNFVADGIVAHNCGKTLAAQCVIEKSGVPDWLWVGPKTSLPNMRREFRKWGFKDDHYDIVWMTYEGLVRLMDEWKQGDAVPHGLICDESSRCKGATSQRTRAVQMCADLIREKWGFNGYVLELSGTPSPKSPVDIWAQCEIAWPGFLKEGSPKALEARCAFIVNQEFDSGVFPKRIGWKDDERKCKKCGEFQLVGPHELDGLVDPLDYHSFEPSINEVAYLNERLNGLVRVKFLKDCIKLPDRRYRKIICKPNASTMRVAKALAESAPNTITGLTWLRELSDGFLYKDVKDGKVACPHCSDSKGQVDEWFLPGGEERVFKAIDMLDPELVSRLTKRAGDCPRCAGRGEIDKLLRTVREVPCPKEKALKLLLDECEETGRIVVFAGFTGSVDRVAGICRKEKWSIVRCDGRGWEVTDHEGNVLTQSGDDALEYWSDIASHPRVSFVSHPESGGMSLTLVESRMAVYWSNSFKPEYRSQSEARIHRKGMDENIGATIVDLIHLPSDEKVLTTIQENRRLELMVLGEISSVFDNAETAEDTELVEV